MIWHLRDEFFLFAVVIGGHKFSACCEQGPLSGAISVPTIETKAAADGLQGTAGGYLFEDSGDARGKRLQLFGFSNGRYRGGLAAPRHTTNKACISCDACRALGRRKWKSLEWHASVDTEPLENGARFLRAGLRVKHRCQGGLFR